MKEIPALLKGKCLACGVKFNFPPQLEGKDKACPKCKRVIRIVRISAVRGEIPANVPEPNSEPNSPQRERRFTGRKRLFALAGVGLAVALAAGIWIFLSTRPVKVTPPITVAKTTAGTTGAPPAPIEEPPAKKFDAWTQNEHLGGMFDNLFRIVETVHPQSKVKHRALIFTVSDSAGIACVPPWLEYSDFAALIEGYPGFSLPKEKFVSYHPSWTNGILRIHFFRNPFVINPADVPIRLPEQRLLRAGKDVYVVTDVSLEKGRMYLFRLNKDLEQESAMEFSFRAGSISGSSGFVLGEGFNGLELRGFIGSVKRDTFTCYLPDEMVGMNCEALANPPPKVMDVASSTDAGLGSIVPKQGFELPWPIRAIDGTQDDLALLSEDGKKVCLTSGNGTVSHRFDLLEAAQLIHVTRRHILLSAWSSNTTRILNKDDGKELGKTYCPLNSDDYVVHDRDSETLYVSTRENKRTRHRLPLHDLEEGRVPDWEIFDDRSLTRGKQRYDIVGSPPKWLDYLKHDSLPVIQSLQYEHLIHGLLPVGILDGRDINSIHLLDMGSEKLWMPDSTGRFLIWKHVFPPPKGDERLRFWVPDFAEMNKTLLIPLPGRPDGADLVADFPEDSPFSIEKGVLKIHFRPPEFSGRRLEFRFRDDRGYWRLVEQAIFTAIPIEFDVPQSTGHVFLDSEGCRVLCGGGYGVENGDIFLWAAQDEEWVRIAKDRGVEAVQVEENDVFILTEGEVHVYDRHTLMRKSRTVVHGAMETYADAQYRIIDLFSGRSLSSVRITVGTSNIVQGFFFKSQGELNLYSNQQIMRLTEKMIPLNRVQWTKMEIEESNIPNPHLFSKENTVLIDNRFYEFDPKAKKPILKRCRILKDEQFRQPLLGIGDHLLDVHGPQKWFKVYDRRSGKLIKNVEIVPYYDDVEIGIIPDYGYYVGEKRSNGGWQLTVFHAGTFERKVVFATPSNTNYKIREVTRDVLSLELSGSIRHISLRGIL